MVCCLLDHRDGIDVITSAIEHHYCFIVTYVHKWLEQELMIKFRSEVEDSSEKTQSSFCTREINLMANKFLKIFE